MIGQRPQRAITAGDPRRSLRSRQGLTPLQVDALRERQHGRCALCLRPLGVRFAIDHDHALAAAHGHDAERGCLACVRGGLCFDCNGWLRGWRDDPEFLLRAAKYVASRRTS